MMRMPYESLRKSTVRAIHQLFFFLMAEGFDPGSHALRWAEGSTADLIGLLHEHASVLQELRVE